MEFFFEKIVNLANLPSFQKKNSFLGDKFPSFLIAELILFLVNSLNEILGKIFHSELQQKYGIRYDLVSIS